VDLAPYKAFVRPYSDDADVPEENLFTPVDPAWLDEARRAFPAALPPALVRFWTEVGFGQWVKARDGSGHAGSANVIVAPHQAARDFVRFRRFCQDTRRAGVALPFFLLDEGSYLSIECGGGADGAVTIMRERDNAVAPSFEAFLASLCDDPGFYARRPAL